MTVGDRIREIRDLRAMSRPKLAERSGVKYPTLAGIENGDQASSTALPAIASALRANPMYLSEGKLPRLLEDYQPEADWSDILGYSQQVGLSDGEEAEEYSETHKLKFRADSLARKRLSPKTLAVFYGKGDSMEPRIHSGDAILFDESDTKPRDGGIYVILVPGAGAESYSVKRCELIDDLVLFKSDNPKGDHGWRRARRMDDPKNPIKIIGRVRWIGSWEG